MWRYMESKKPNAFVEKYEDGIKRVLEENYAFLMESTMLDYAVQRDCNLTQIGGLLDTKGINHSRGVICVLCYIFKNRERKFW